MDVDHEVTIPVNSNQSPQQWCDNSHEIQGIDGEIKDVSTEVSNETA